MLPINKKYPIRELIQACHEYVDQTHRRISFEWALIRDVNDSRDQAERLAKLLAGLVCHVNIIPLNPTLKYSGQGTTSLRAQEFQQELESHGVPCSTRLRRGIDIQAGCGQLAIQYDPVEK
jgi:23S rRNA (adenine2503-C2)-methyltransferase